MRNKKMRDKNVKPTLIASIWMAAITSSDPPKTRLSSRDGSYSQMAVAFSTAVIFAICFMTSTFPRFTTWPKQLDYIKFIRESKKKSMNLW